jgi:hypothetical protein
MNKFELKSFNETWTEVNGTKEQVGAANKNLLFAKKEATLSACKKTAYVEYLDAQQRVKEAVVTEGEDIAVAVKLLESKQRAYEFYNKLYNDLFPNV